MLLSTWALMSIATACQPADSLIGPSSEVLELDPIVATVDQGDTLRLSAWSTNGSGPPKPLDPNQVDWMTSDPDVSVVEAGLVRSVGPGDVRITALSPSGAAGFADITVRPQPPEPEADSDPETDPDPEAAPDIDAVGGDGQTGTPGEELSEPLVVKVTDAAGNPVTGVSVAWSVDVGAGRVEAAAEESDEQGLVEATWILGASVGGQRVSAVAEEVGSVSFTAQAEQEPTVPSSYGLLPAFPGAEGWGATALNECRDLPLVVHQVTNTNDDGPGSLRDVLMNRARGDRFDIVVFRTGGLITLGSPIERKYGHCLYVAGQTAPGEGISLVAATLMFDNSDDVVLRHIRHRGKNGGDALLHFGGSRVVYDHISASWIYGRYIVRFKGDVGRPISDVTFQNSLLYEPDVGHPTVLGLSGHPKPDPLARRMSVHRNALLGPGRRMPKCHAYEVSVVNNVIYNWQQRGAATNNTGSCDFVRNYLKPGPTTRAASNLFGRRPFVFGDACVDAKPGDVCSYSHYVAENRSHVNGFALHSSNDPWDGPNREVSCNHNATGFWCEDHDVPWPVELRRFSSLPPATIPVSRRLITDDFVEEIVSEAGHSRGLACDGSWRSIRDRVDAERVEWFRTGTGFAANIQVADMTVPIPAAGSACQDEDGDGIPSQWEQRFFGCETCAQPSAVGAGGYLVIEHYLNGTDPR